MEKKKPYKIIQCDVYDELTLLAVRKKQCTIHYYDEAGTAQECQSVIKDIYTKNKAEYLLLEIGLTIRLDRLIKVEERKTVDG